MKGNQTFLPDCGVKRHAYRGPCNSIAGFCRDRFDVAFHFDDALHPPNWQNLHISWFSLSNDCEGGVTEYY